MTCTEVRSTGSCIRCSSSAVISPPDKANAEDKAKAHADDAKADLQAKAKSKATDAKSKTKSKAKDMSSARDETHRERRA
jgi:hypothetical protein